VRDANKKVQKLIKRARISLLFENHFIGDILFLLEGNIIATEKVPTVATDGQYLYANEKFVESLKPEELKACLAHEALHVAFLHTARRGTRDPHAWNIATDMAINPLLKQCGFQLPKNAFFDAEDPPRTAEAIYAELEKTGVEAALKGGRQCNGKCIMPAGEGVGNGKGAFSSEEAAKDSVQRAKATAAGNMHKAIERALERAYPPPTTKWHDILKRFLRDTVGNSDIATNRFNRFFLEEEGIYIPALKGRQMQKIAFCIDSSGSIGDKDYIEFVGQIKAISEELGFPAAEVLIGDTEVAFRKEFQAGDEIDIPKRHCSGGTLFAPFFRQLEQEPPQVAIFLTDMEPGDWDVVARHPPHYPVYWISTQERKEAPFGITIPIQESA